jgi:haloacetate dehalogenase
VGQTVDEEVEEQLEAVLVHWGAAEDPSPTGPLGVWRRWAGDVRGRAVPGGHFVPEEAAEELVAALLMFLAGRGDGSPGPV